MPNKETIIISLGGSLIAPKEGIDWKFLKKFRELIISQIGQGKRFAIITGGGNTCRRYQEAASKVTKLTDDDKDWLGVHTTRLNAHLVKTIFRDYAHPRINKNPRTKENLKKHFSKGEGIMVAAGWRPGWSTDYVATILAERLDAKKIINLSNIDYAYTSDPNKNKDAKKLINTDWKSFRKIVGDKWDPGLNSPFDPIASKLAQKLNLEVVIMNGKKITNLKNYLDNKKFKGTTIK
ncbi:MAG: UMP kinase [Candidatus Magasanikbacteria bacterium]|nr:UMP kinase [Candidatus Magasanikbacteria bacterium]